MSSVLSSSQGLILATAMAVSGTVLFVTLFRPRSVTLTDFLVNHNSHHRLKQIPPSCLSSDEKKRDRKKKRVHFADSVKDPIGDGEKFRREHSKKSTKVDRSCRKEISGNGGMPANRAALYTGILRDRVHRIECSY